VGGKSYISHNSNTDCRGREPLGVERGMFHYEWGVKVIQEKTNLSTSCLMTWGGGKNTLRGGKKSGLAKDWVILEGGGMDIKYGSLYVTTEGGFAVKVRFAFVVERKGKGGIGIMNDSRGGLPTSCLGGVFLGNGRQCV